MKARRWLNGKSLLGLFVLLLLLFGLKVCVYDHDRQLQLSQQWCETALAQIPAAMQQEAAADNFSLLNQEILRINRELPAPGQQTMLPAQLLLADGEPRCRINYCLRVGLSICEYDPHSKQLSIIEE